MRLHTISTYTQNANSLYTGRRFVHVIHTPVMNSHEKQARTHTNAFSAMYSNQSGDAERVPFACHPFVAAKCITSQTDYLFA